MVVSQRYKALPTLAQPAQGTSLVRAGLFLVALSAGQGPEQRVDLGSQTFGVVAPFE
jgi:hypothetical protein